MQTYLEQEAVQTILVVEPDAEARRHVCAMLAERGHAAYAAETHRKALAMLDTIPFSVLLCCASPRRMTYREFVAEAKAYQPSLAVIIATTGNHDPEDCGSADRLLSKPLTIEDVDGAIRELAQR